ncbi:MAG TPA: glycosyl hydrolase family 18 protein [Acidimicrobiales bacterium]
MRWRWDRFALPARLSRAVASPLRSGAHRSRRAYIIVGAVLVLGMASGVALTAIPGTNGSTLAANHTRFQRGNAQFRPLDRSTPTLTPATAAPLPAPTSVADAAPLRPHEVFGFAPYWTLSSSSGFDVNGLTTVAYFNVDVNADGTLDQSGPGWDGLQSQAFADLANRAHAAGDRVVLTAGQFDQSALDQLTSSPTAPATLAAQLTSTIESKNLDGVNFDLEGEGSGDQTGLTNLITQVSSHLHAVNPHWQVTVDTYASSAGDPNGFYDVPAIAPAVDGFFVMAYQLNLDATPQATSPLTSSMFSDLTTVQQYTAAVPASKVILGTPYYGEDWPTTDGTLTAQATGGETPVTYGQVMASGHPRYRDPVTGTAWTAYQVGSQWHETFFEDPTSLYQLAQLGQSYGLGGLGIWALGMDGNDPSMLAALDGFAPVTKVQPSGPDTNPAPSSSVPTIAPTAPPAEPSTPTGTRTQPVTPSPVAAGTTPGTAPTTPTTGTPPSGTTTPTTGTPPSGTTPPPPALTYIGQWHKPVAQPPTDPPPVPMPVTLSPVAAVTMLFGAVSVGTLTGFTTTDPQFTCLAAEPSLSVWQLPPPTSSTPTTTSTTPSSTTTTPGTTTTTSTTPPNTVQYTVVASQPTDCMTASFVFSVPVADAVAPSSAATTAPTTTTVLPAG